MEGQTLPKWPSKSRLDSTFFVVCGLIFPQGLTSSSSSGSRHLEKECLSYLVTGAERSCVGRGRRRRRTSVVSGKSGVTLVHLVVVTCFLVLRFLSGVLMCVSDTYVALSMSHLSRSLHTTHHNTYRLRNIQHITTHVASQTNNNLMKSQQRVYRFVGIKINEKPFSLNQCEKIMMTITITKRLTMMTLMMYMSFDSLQSEPSSAAVCPPAIRVKRNTRE